MLPVSSVEVIEAESRRIDGEGSLQVLLFIEKKILVSRVIIGRLYWQAGSRERFI